jgi:hypothetical protein
MDADLALERGMRDIMTCQHLVVHLRTYRHAGRLLPVFDQEELFLASDRNHLLAGSLPSAVIECQIQTGGR